MSVNLQASPSSLTFSLSGYCALLGNLPGATEPNGDCWVYQDITIPAGTTTLSFQYWPGTTDTISFDWQECQIQSTTAGTGAIGVLSLNNGGTGYNPGDTGTVNGGTADAIYEVVTTGAGGAVTSFQMNAMGTSGYPVGAAMTTRTTGSGSGLSFIVNAVNLAQVFKVCNNTLAWTAKTFDLSPYAATTVRLWFNEHGDDANDSTFFFLSAVSALNGSQQLVENKDFTTGDFTDWHAGNYSSVGTTVANIATGGSSGPAFTPVVVAGSYPDNLGSQSVAITVSDGSSTAYTLTTTQSWLSSSPGGGTAPDTETVTINATGLSPGTHTGSLILTDTYEVKGSAVIPFTVPAPGGNWSNAGNYFSTNIAFSRTDTSGYLGISFSNTLANPTNCWLMKFDRSTNSIVWSVQTQTGASSNQWNVSATIVSIDGVHVYTAYTHDNSGTNTITVDKRNTSDGSLVTSVDVTPFCVPTDIDIASIGGIEYLALAGINTTNPSDDVYPVLVLSTSALAGVYSFTEDPGASLSENPTPVAFDGSGNLWWLHPITDGSLNLASITIPGGVKTERSLATILTGTPYSGESPDTLTFDPVSGDLSVNAVDRVYRLTTAPVFVNDIVVSSGAYLEGNFFGPSDRLFDSAEYISARGVGFWKSDLSAGYSYGKVQASANGPDAVYPVTLDDTSINPHITSIIDMTLWTGYENNLPTGVATAIAYFDIAIVNPVTIPVTLTITEASSTFCPVQLINGNFMDALGNRLAYGYLKLQLTKDTLICTHNGQLVAGRKFKVNLDENGNIAGVVEVEPNDLLLPTGSQYRTLAFAHDGTQAWSRSQYWTVPSTAATLDVGTLVPTQ